MTAGDAPGSSWIGRDVGGYRVLQELGGGGMGMVFLAEHRLLGRRAALKLIRPEVAGDPTFAARFRHEARAIARLDHPGIVRLWDFAIWEGIPYMVMEPAPGRDLEQLIRTGPAPPAVVLRLLRQAAEGLDHAHQLGVVHRDIKPTNIRVDFDGRSRIIDFGLACVEGATLATSPEAFLGSPDYVAPEQISGGTVDARSDVYSLAAVIFESITGRRPFIGNSWIEVASKRLLEPAPVAPGVPEPFAQVLASAMSRDPGPRPPGALALVEALWRSLGFARTIA
ncbi:MAG: serine/threonine-protein kinase [Candidatus Dormibacteraceae bacterium]